MPFMSSQIRLQSRGGHSAKPPIDGSSIGGKMGRLMTAVSSNPPAAKLVSPTKEFVIGLADIAPGGAAAKSASVMYKDCCSGWYSNPCFRLSSVFIV